jgi:hypothetical protein
MKKIHLLLLLFFFFLCQEGFLFGQNTCTSDFIPKYSTQKGAINWKQFPEFSLPFTIVYGGPRLRDSLASPLKHGFSHLSTFTASDSMLPQKNRAIIWYGVASISGEPWYEKESPWGNNIPKYEEHWRNNMAGFASWFLDSRGQKFPKTDILLLDIERERPSESSILKLKADTTIASKYRTLSDIDFVERYKRDLSNLYASPIRYLKKEGLPPDFNIASYSDAPIKNNEYPISTTWQDWQKSNKVLNYYMKDTLSGGVGGDFYQQNSFITPSAYLCYEAKALNTYPNVAYQLFQIEVNKGRTNKDLVLFEWLKYNRCLPQSGYDFSKYIDDYLIDAQAIFPFFAGAKGIWLWEDPTAKESDNYASFERFTNALYRLSKFKNYFVGNTETITPTPAYDYFITQKPLWRGIVKDNRILVAAINEFAKDNETTNLTVNYGKWSTTIQLKGRETFLCDFDLPIQENEFLVYPNPSFGQFRIKSFGKLEGDSNFTIRILDLFGRTLYQEKRVNLLEEYFVHPDLLASGNYILLISNDKILVHKMITIKR